MLLFIPIVGIYLLNDVRGFYWRPSLLTPPMFVLA